MNRIFLVLTLISVAGSSWAAKPTKKAAAEEAMLLAAVTTAKTVQASLDAGNIQAAEQQLPEIENPAERLYAQTRIEMAKGNPTNAIKVLAQLIVRYPNDQDWIAQSELLMAKLDLELGLTHAADVTARQVQILHEGTEEANKAAALQAEIAKLKESAE